jgi:hypothetical protein
MFGFGFVFPKWRTAPYYEAPAIGRLPLDNADFDPESWRPRVPNQAFLHARPDDKFWAASKLVALTTPMLRAAVKAGDFGDPAAEEFLVRALAERRDAIARVYLTSINPISDPKIDAAGMLTFQNRAVDGDFAHTPLGYRAVWSLFDNATGSAKVIADTSDTGTGIQGPALPEEEGSFVKVQLSALDGPDQSWEEPVSAYFRFHQSEWQLVGFERMGSR